VTEELKKSARSRSSESAHAAISGESGRPDVRECRWEKAECEQVGGVSGAEILENH